MQLKKYAVRVSMFIFTFIYACIGNAEYRHIRGYFLDEEVRAIPCKVQDDVLLRRAMDIDLTGEYRVANPTIPKAFSDIRMLQVSTQWYDPQRINSDWSGAIAPGGYLYAPTGHSLIWSAQTPASIAFESEPSNGTSYRFSGRARQWHRADGSGAQLEISGTLYLISYGRIVDSMYVVFSRDGC
jgi:hypothetical protein